MKRYLVALAYGDVKVIAADTPEEAARHAFAGNGDAAVGWETLVVEEGEGRHFALLPVDKVASRTTWHPGPGTPMPG